MFIVKEKFQEEYQEARREPRRIVRCGAWLFLKGGEILYARTLDVSWSGMALMLDVPLDNVRQCIIAFDALAAGVVTRVSVSAETVYCICVGTSGFRVGFKFDPSDESGIKAARRLL